MLLASTGMRIGAIPSLKLRNLEKINDVYKIVVYEGFRQEYFTFCSQECAKVLDFIWKLDPDMGKRYHKNHY
ncbi:MAG TPA: hypothetical protein VH481_02775 [Nitrososphaeraceae archaeon]